MTPYILKRCTHCKSISAPHVIVNKSSTDEATAYVVSACVVCDVRRGGCEAHGPLVNVSAHGLSIEETAANAWNNQIDEDAEHLNQNELTRSQELDELRSRQKYLEAQLAALQPFVDAVKRYTSATKLINNHWNKDGSERKASPPLNMDDVAGLKLLVNHTRGKFLYAIIDSEENGLERPSALFRSDIPHLDITDKQDLPVLVCCDQYVCFVNESPTDET
jgi:hypothetical protein